MKWYVVAVSFTQLMLFYRQKFNVEDGGTTTAEIPWWTRVVFQRASNVLNVQQYLASKEARVATKSDIFLYLKKARNAMHAAKQKKAKIFFRLNSFPLTWHVL